MFGDAVVAGGAAVDLVVNEMGVVGADVDVVVDRSGSSTCMQSFKRWQIISLNIELKQMEQITRSTVGKYLLPEVEAIQSV